MHSYNFTLCRLRHQPPFVQNNPFLGTIIQQRLVMGCYEQSGPLAIDFQELIHNLLTQGSIKIPSGLIGQKN